MISRQITHPRVGLLWVPTGKLRTVLNLYKMEAHKPIAPFLACMTEKSSELDLS